MTKLDQKIWDEASKDAAILEAKISEMIDAFEQKHKPIQVNVLTRFRNFRDLYIKSKGGAAQIALHDTGARNDEIAISESNYSLDPIHEIFYSID